MILERLELDSSAFALLFTEISVVRVTEISVKSRRIELISCLKISCVKKLFLTLFDVEIIWTLFLGPKR